MLRAGRNRVRQIAKKLNPRTLWYDRSVRTQLLATVGIVNLLAASVAGAVWILNTRTATRVEIEASLEVAQGFARATVRDLANQERLDMLSKRLPQELRNLRHVRILLMDGGKLTMLQPESKFANGDPLSRWAPKWFAALVGPKLSGRSVRVVSASRVDPIIIIGEPADEIAEAWRDFSSLAIIWISLNALVVGILYVVLGRVLDPLANLARGMQSLKGGRYAIRIKPPRVKELALITNRFNMLAGGLDAAREENSRLYRQLISTQEQVRREIADELHDEAGACLFGIAANASSIRTFVNELPGERTAEIREHVGNILAGADRLKSMNRAILKQLRPGPLGQVRLPHIIEELVTGLQRNHRGTQVVATIGDLAKSYGEGIDLTLYRCIQEGVTAAIRNGKSKNISVDIAEQLLPARRARKGRRPALHLTLRFDGDRFPPSKPKDFTLATMVERVRSLGGACAIKRSASKGTTIRIEIPIKRAPAERALAPT
jgi:two-component system sensor histidine kinase UhpB